MKMNFAGLLPNPNVNPENFRFNCTRNKACQLEFFIPVNNICDFMLFFDLPFLPVSYTLEIVDSCTGEVQAANVINYVAASHTDGFYAIFAGLTSGPLPTFFYLQASFFSSADVEAVFYSNDFEIVTCEQLTKISSCYNDAAPGTEAFDINGVYYGQPLGTVLGNANVRYYHFLKVRKGSVLNNKTKLSLNAFNYNRVYKGQASQQYNFFSESVPEFYKEEILAVIARGNILINEKPYQVADEIELSLVDEDSQRWAMNIALNKVLFNYFSCKQTVCLVDPCQPILPPAPCCDPIVNSSAVELVAGSENIINRDGTYYPITQIYISYDANPGSSLLMGVTPTYPIPENNERTGVVPTTFNDQPGVSVIVYIDNPGNSSLGLSLRVTDSLGVVRCDAGSSFASVLLVAGCRLSNEAGFTIELFSGAC